MHYIHSATITTHDEHASTAAPSDQREPCAAQHEHNTCSCVVSSCRVCVSRVCVPVAAHSLIPPQSEWPLHPVQLTRLAPIQQLTVQQKHNTQKKTTHIEFLVGQQNVHAKPPPPPPLSRNARAAAAAVVSHAAVIKYKFKLSARACRRARTNDRKATSETTTITTNTNQPTDQHHIIHHIDAQNHQRTRRGGERATCAVCI